MLNGRRLGGKPDYIPEITMDIVSHLQGDSVASKGKVDAEFWDRADSHINLANEHCGKTEAGKVSASLLFAASRFNAFIVASQAPSAEALRAMKDEALDYFTSQFRNMLDENLEDYVKHFKKYIGK